MTLTTVAKMFNTLSQQKYFSQYYYYSVRKLHAIYKISALHMNIMHITDRTHNAFYQA